MSSPDENNNDEDLDSEFEMYSLKDLSLEDGEISMMEPSFTDDESIFSNFPFDYDFDADDAEMKNIVFPEIQEPSSEAPTSQEKIPENSSTSIDDSDINYILEYLDNIAQGKSRSTKPSLDLKKLKARRKIDFTNMTDTNLKVSIRMDKLKKIGEKTPVTKSIIAHSTSDGLQFESGPSTSKNPEITPVLHTPPCVLGKLCFICNKFGPKQK